MALDPNGFVSSLQSRLALDARALAAFRIALGAVLLWDVAARLPDLVALYSDAGAVPRTLVFAESSPPLHFRGLLLGGSPLVVGLGLLALAVSALGLVLGKYTRVCTIVCWLLWCSLMARNPFVLNFGDRILRVVLFFAVFLPLGRALSLDARSAPERPPVEIPFAALAFQLQVVFVYFVGALHKNDPVWLSGQAIGYVLAFDQITLPLGHALAMFPRALEALTWATLVFEAAIVPLVLSPWRTALLRSIVVVCAIAFHLGLAATLLLGHFPFVCIAVWLAFLPAAVWDRLGLGRGRAAPPDAVPSPWQRVGTIAVTAALALVVIYNAFTLATRHVPPALDAIAQPLGLDQRWTMFAPHPNRVDGWFVAAGQRADGSLVDAWAGEGAPSYEKPDDPAGRYPHTRWMSFMVKLSANRERSAQGRELAAYLCRRWNAEHPSEPIVLVGLDFVQELTLPDGSEDGPIRIPVARANCESRRPRGG